MERCSPPPKSSSSSSPSSAHRAQVPGAVRLVVLGFAGEVHAIQEVGIFAVGGRVPPRQGERHPASRLQGRGLDVETPHTQGVVHVNARWPNPGMGWPTVLSFIASSGFAPSSAIRSLSSNENSSATPSL